jgi:hypothetical protein
VFSRVVLLILLFDTNLDEHRVTVRREHLGFLLSETVRNPEEYTRNCRGIHKAEGDLDRVAVAGAGGRQCLGASSVVEQEEESSTLISEYSSSITHRGYAAEDEDEPDGGWVSMAAADDVRCPIPYGEYIRWAVGCTYMERWICVRCIAIYKQKLSLFFSFLFFLLSSFWYILLPPSVKTCNYGLRAGKSSSRLTKFIVNSIHIYGSKSIYYENIFYN